MSKRKSHQMINIGDQNKKYISIYETQNWPSGFFRLKKTLHKLVVKSTLVAEACRTLYSMRKAKTFFVLIFFQWIIFTNPIKFSFEISAFFLFHIQSVRVLTLNPVSSLREQKNRLKQPKSSSYKNIDFSLKS